MAKCKPWKSEVEVALEKYRFFLLSFPIELTPKITSSYSLVPPTNTNQFHSSTEQTAIDRVDRDIARAKHIDWVLRAVNRLSEIEREIIFKRYLDHEEAYDYEIYNAMGMSERKYYRLKARTFYKLALIFGFVTIDEAV
ncbi:ArpU family transcriptional regulator [Bacillus sp. AFS015802]|uniref:ArpU family phage packaging/lysis transcriptional regulator n=1 Tax=Bacillus sp. AFS015802 TaxID=2033486 RepID=UPI000BF8FA82|nr:ArpU family phage packaging/lysis transcriptional regulator [Bacillus sp. AFS015802]PFA66853.1 ArpU family transcriptional regulator [Bacillus sp. AFS015802]